MIPQERAERIGSTLRFVEPFEARRNIRWRGDELKRGDPLAEAGQRVGPGLLASLVNADVETLTLRRQPRLKVFVTGDEIRPFGTPLRPGEIHDSNGPLVTAVLSTWGYTSPAAQHLGDDRNEVLAALESAFADCDVVISTGGASVGDKDYLPAAAESLGVKRVFWKVAQKPGKPIFFGVLDRPDGSQCAMLALPGNPGAVLIGLLLHVRAALDALEGARDIGVPWYGGLLTEDTERDLDRTRLVRMKLEIGPGGVAALQPLPHQDSHMLSNLGRADVLVWIEAGPTPVAAGSMLRWTPMPG
jgi:molybdopterin molybdotransferase